MIDPSWLDYPSESQAASRVRPSVSCRNRAPAKKESVETKQDRSDRDQNRPRHRRGDQQQEPHERGAGIGGQLFGKASLNKTD